MKRIAIPENAWMRYRSRGRYLYARNANPIVWGSTEPPAGEPVYVLNWHNGQNTLQACRIIAAPGKKP